MPDVKPPVIAIPRTDPLKAHVCPTCHQPDKPVQRVPLTGFELIAHLRDVPDICLAHYVRLGLAPSHEPPLSMYAYVYGVQSGGGPVNWVALELGPVQVPILKEKTT